MKKSDLRKVIIEEINRIEPGEFHHLCIEYLSERFNQRFVNSGVNKRNRPVAYDLDGISPDSSVAGEFSVDQDYFKKGLSKLRYDLNHSLARIPGPTEIILISSQSASNLERRQIQKYLKYISFLTKKEISFIDANQLADEIIHFSSKSSTFYEACAPYLIAFRQIMILFGAENLFPSNLTDYKERKSSERDLAEAINKNQIVLLHGLSGIGKSELVIKSRSLIGLKFDHLIWVNGDELRDLASLSSYTLKRFGNPYDLKSLLAEADVLMCIDSLEGKDAIINEFHQIKMSAGSRVVITSQKNLAARNITPFGLHGMTFDEFHSVISDGNGMNEEISKRFYELSEGHPLVASTINKMIRAEDINLDQLSGIVESVGTFESHRNETILDSLFKKHLGLLKDAFSFIKTIDTNRPHIKMVEKIIGLPEIAKLRHRGFLKDNGDGFYKIHDLVFHTIKQSPTILKDAQWEDKLIELFNSKDQLSELEFYQISNNHFNLLENIAWSRVSITAFYLICSYTEVDDKFDEEKIHKHIFPTVQSINADKASFQEAMLCIEYYEVMYRYNEYYKRDRASSKEMAQAGLSFCEEVLRLQPSNAFLKNIYHHAGKFSRQLHQTKEAIEFFLKALAEDDDFSETKLQLFRSFHWVDTDRASTDLLKKLYGGRADTRYITDILDKCLTRFESVSPSVALHSFQELRKSPFYSTIDSLIPKYEELFFRTVKTAQFTNRNDYLEVVGGIGEKFIANDPKKFALHFTSMSIPSPQQALGKSNFSIGQIYKYIAREKRDISILDLAGLYYEKVLKQDHVRDFELTHIIDYFNICSDYKRSSELYERVRNKSEAFALLRHAWTLYGLGEKDKALLEVGLAIKALPEHYHPQHMRTFLSLQERVSCDMGLDTAITWKTE